MEIVERIVMAVLLLILLILWVVDIEKRQKRNDRVTEQIEDLANTIKKSQKGERMARYANVDKLMEHAIRMDWSVLKWVNEVDISTAINPNVVERKKGKWKQGYCLECGYNWGNDAPIASAPNFCPNCGTDMR